MLDPTIKTQRLVLRSFTETDTPALEKLAGAWDVARMTLRIRHPYSRELARPWIASHAAERASGHAYTFAVACDDQLVGCIGLHREVPIEGAPAWAARVPNPGTCFEIGYWIGVPFWGRGYASEAAAATIQFAFRDLAKTHLVAGCFTDNGASRRVLDKLGFAEQGRAICHSVARGEVVECALLALTRDAWAAKKV